MSFFKISEEKESLPLPEPETKPETERLSSPLQKDSLLPTTDSAVISSPVNSFSSSNDGLDDGNDFTLEDDPTSLDPPSIDGMTVNSKTETVFKFEWVRCVRVRVCRNMGW